MLNAFLQADLVAVLAAYITISNDSLEPLGIETAGAVVVQVEFLLLVSRRVFLKLQRRRYGAR